MKQIIYFICCFICMYSLLLNFLTKTSADNTTQTKTEALAIYQSLLDITFPYTIMCIAAHPDDEDSDALAFYRMKYGARTVLVTATRGEGGQNSQGPELYEDLAIIRAKETVAMANRLDTVAINLAMPDFGFSKSSEETFKIWNRREALRRLVFAIRAFKPDIIITVHDRKTGHGHHQATRLLAEEAYTLAADRFAFSEQFTGLGRLEPWQVKRLFARTLSKTKFDTEFDANQVSSIYNQSYSQIGYQSRLEHRTQGPWPQIDLKSERMVRFNLIKSTDEDFRRWYLLWQGIPNSDVYNKIQTILFDEQVDGVEKLSKLPTEALTNRLIKALNVVNSYLKEEGKSSDYQAKLLLEKLQKALLIVTKISLKVTPSIEKTSPGQSFTASLSIYNPTKSVLEVKSLSLATPNFWEYEEKNKLNTSIEAGATNDQEITIKLGLEAKATLPSKAFIYDLDFLEPQINAIAKITLPELNEPIFLISKS
ncbi:MAG: PIG-L family deacetylase [Acidobacteria bacterium]|nr:PIG-L family deacetylase [Acidobacteriota bacterium]